MRDDVAKNEDEGKNKTGRIRLETEDAKELAKFFGKKIFCPSNTDRLILLRGGKHYLSPLLLEMEQLCTEA